MDDGAAADSDSGCQSVRNLAVVGPAGWRAGARWPDVARGRK
jgi:hypothetical protein